MQVLKGGALVNESMDAGNIAGGTHKLAMSAPGSPPITPMPGPPNTPTANLPLPLLDGEPQIPVSTQPGKYGGVGLPAPGANQSAPLRQPQETAPQGAGSAGIVQLAKDGGGFTAGIQPGGNQGAGNPGAGSSGNGSVWGPTPGNQAPAWGESNSEA